LNADLVLLAGATGAIGRHAATLLRHRGFRVRALGRQPDSLAAVDADEIHVGDLTQPDTLRDAASGCRFVLSAAGARMSLGAWRERASFPEVDDLGNRALLQEARRSRVEKFVYVSVAGALPLRGSVYVQSHERFVQTLAQSGLPYAVVRPTGLFCFFLQLLDAARRGPLFLPGDGAARTNPVHEADAARACVDALLAPELQIVAGGPEIFTRARLLELVFEAISRPPRVKKAPEWLFRAPLPLLRPAQPRIAALLEFGLAVSRVDVIAPAYGQQRLGDYLRAAALR
jgi:uncharacterized protein YbjT (DUF2867 family)